MNRMGNGRIGRGIAVIVIMGLSCVSARADYSGGTGEPNDPFQIATVADWQELMAATGDWGRHFLLTADLDMNGVAMTPVGNYANRFTGVFDGNDHVIGNVDINMPNAYYVGLFGYVDSGADIRNIGIEDANIAGKYYVGGLVGYNSNGSITDCYATGPVTGDDRVGGLVGRNKDGDISNCYATGSVDGYDYVGGLVGGNFNGSITDCCATGPVTGDYRVGGLVGRNEDGDISNCYATGSVAGSDDYVGGLVGYNSGSITDCYATGPVTGDDRVGGLVGRNEYGIITNCYATGSVSGHDYVGGLVGRDNYGNITNCYAAGSVTGNTSVGGLVGGNYEPKSTSNCYTTGLIQGVSEVGGLIGRSGRDSISNCYTIGSVYGDNYVGGLVGRSGCDNISNSYTTGLVEGVSSVGGLVGEVQWTTITDCHATGSVTGSGDYVGGLLGFLPKTPRHPSFPQMEISNCYATGSVIGRNYVGGLVAYGIGTLTNCYAIGSVSGYEDVGGLMGYNYQCVITNCYATGSVKGTHTTGSMVGTNREGTITNCCAAGPVSGNQYTGGIAGLNWFYGSISNCCSIGSVTGSGDYVGGLAGECSGSFTNCYSTSPISGAGDYVGGLVGLSFHGIITDCYAAGLINAVGNYVGGLVGENDSGSVTRVYFLDPNDGGGPDNGYGEPLTDLQMRQQVSFIDWDFVGAGDGDEDIWSICEGVGYPRLYWEKCPMAAGPELGSFEIIEKTRIGRSVFRYVLGVAIANNSNVALTDVRLSLVNSSPQVTAVIDGEIALDSVGAWALIDTSAVGEYFIIDVDRTAPIEVEEMSLRLRCNSAGGDCCIMLLPVPIDARPVVLNMAKLAEMWLWAGPSGAIAEDVVPDGRVNFADFAMLYDRLPGEE